MLSFHIGIFPMNPQTALLSGKPATAFFPASMDTKPLNAQNNKELKRHV